MSRAQHARTLIASAVVAGSGFGVLGCWWVSREWPTTVPGWTDYRSTVVGDGILLPLLVGSLLDASDRLPKAPGERRHAAVTGAAGFALGAILQAVWLSDDHPQLNWNMLEAHRFNAPGWYHAVFLSVMTGVIGALSGWLLARLKNADDLPHAHLIFYGAFGFVLLIALDVLFPAGPAARNLWPGGLAPAVLAVGSVAVAATLLRPRGQSRDIRAHLVRCSMGAGAAALLAVSCLPWPTSPAMLVAEAVAISIGLAVGGRMRISRPVTEQSMMGD